MTYNANPSEIVATLAAIAPASQAVGTVTSGWVSMTTAKTLLAIIATGVLGASATVDAKIQQAVDSSGTSAKDITGKAITQIVKATGDNKVALINVRDTDLDVNNGFAYVQLSITVGTAASLVGALLVSPDTDYQTADQFNAAAVTQIVG